MPSKKIIYFLCSVFFFVILNASEHAISILDHTKVKILTPSLQQKKTLKLQLKNGLKVYLISDPEADKSAAAMSIETGSWHDPENQPGLAHFLEHMLFLGNKKYPAPEHFQNFITTSGGMLNAYTASDHTVFGFNINNSDFSEALDMWSQFFISPLFDPNSLAKEKEVVDQEYKRDIGKEDWRTHMVSKMLSDPSHPYSAFSIGSKETLLHSTQKDLQEWFHGHYGARWMCLVLYSNLPLDTLKSLVENDFSGILAGKKTPAFPDEKIFLSQNLGKIVYIEPIYNVKNLTLTWEFAPSVPINTKNKADKIIACLLNNKAKGSLSDLLLNKGLASQLHAASEISGKNKLIEIEIQLTDLGLKNYNEVISLLYAYIHLLQKKGIPEYFYHELEEMALIQYQYQTRTDSFSTTMKLAAMMRKEPLETFPEENFLFTQFDPTLIKKILQEMTPENCFYTLKAPQPETPFKANQIEPRFQVAYSIHPIDPLWLKKWNNAPIDPLLTLPDQNPFIPENLKLVQTSSSLTPLSLSLTPTLLADNEKTKTYFATDTSFLVPEIFYEFRLQSPLLHNTEPLHTVLKDIMIEFYNEILNTTLYQAKMARIDTSLIAIPSGISLTISGLSSKAPTLLQTILNLIQQTPIDPTSFEKAKEVLLKRYENSAESEPLYQAVNLARFIEFKYSVLPKERLKILLSITFEQVASYQKQIFEKTYLEGMLYGNLNQKQAKELVSIWENPILGTPLPVEERFKQEVVFLPENKGPFLIKKATKRVGNVSLVAIENGCFSFPNQALLKVGMNMLSPAFYDELRSKQKTSYALYALGLKRESQLFSWLIVESHTHNARDLLARQELFLEDFIFKLNSEEKAISFENTKRSVIEELLQPPINLQEEGQRLSTLAFEEQGQFDWYTKLIDATQAISIEDFKSFIVQSFGRKNKKRVAILIEGSIPLEDQFDYQTVRKPERLRSFCHYSSECMSK